MECNSVSYTPFLLLYQVQTQIAVLCSETHSFSLLCAKLSLNLRVDNKFYQHGN